MNKLFNIRGIVIVTGAAGLMGKEHARAILNYSGSVAINPRSEEILTIEP